MSSTDYITDSDTIAAIATASGAAGIGVIRVSGEQVEAITAQLYGRLPQPRTAVLTKIKDVFENTIDQVMILYFPSPGSFTGESVLEIHGHGGVIVLDRLLARIYELGARPARPGEFSLRAFLNNKIDLAQAEAIADLINASSEQAAKAAALSLEGYFSNKINDLKEKLIYLRSHVESAIDFSEEEIDFAGEDEIKKQTRRLLGIIQALITDAAIGKLLREGITVVISGKPNAGKSSLLNRLSAKDAAIVTDIPGTTRDLLKETINMDGLLLNIIDTAGLRDSDNPIEKEGIRRAREQIGRADLVLHIVDIQENHVDHDELTNAAHKTITVYNKIDLMGSSDVSLNQNPLAQDAVYISAKTGQGLNDLKKLLKIRAGFENNPETVFIARQRHLDSLQHCSGHLQQALSRLRGTPGALELLAEELLYAQQALNRITGEFSNDDLLGEIFSQFCIGK